MNFAIGSVILLMCGDALFDFTAADWANFLSVNCIGAYALAWVSGITFMVHSLSPYFTSIN